MARGVRTTRGAWCACRRRVLGVGVVLGERNRIAARCTTWWRTRSR